eukprot:2078380-Rhodomonas_salina.3
MAVGFYELDLSDREQVCLLWCQQECPFTATRLTIMMGAAVRSAGDRASWVAFPQPCAPSLCDVVWD